MSVFYSACVVLLNGFYFFCFKRLYSRALGISLPAAWMIGVYFFICIPFTLIALNNGYTIRWAATGSWTTVDLNDFSFFYSFLIIFISQVLMCTVFLTLNYYANENISAVLLIKKSNIRRITLFLYFSCIFSIVVWLLSIYSAGGLIEYFILYWYLRSAALQELIGSSYVILSYASIANNILFSASAAVYIAKNALKNNGLLFDRVIFIIIIMSLLDLVFSGNRINIAILGILLISIAIQFKMRRYLKMLLVIIPFAVMFFSLWPSLRGHLSDIKNGLEIHEMRSQAENTILMPIIDAVEGSAVMLLFHIIKDFGDRFDYLYGASYIRMFDFLIDPSRDRSENFSIYLARIFEDTDETSFTATILGEAYANFGSLCVLILPAGLIMSYVLAFLSGKNALNSTIGFLLILKSMRYFFSVILIISLFLILLFYIYKYISRLSVLNRQVKT